MKARGEPVALALTALAPQLFRDLVVRSFCVSRFTVNKKAQIHEEVPCVLCKTGLGIAIPWFCLALHYEGIRGL